MKPTEQTRNDDDNTVSAVETDDAGGYRNVGQVKTASAYREKQEAQHAEKIADAADAEMAVELTDDELKTQEERDREYAETVQNQLHAEEEEGGGQLANAPEPVHVGEDWAKVTAATIFSQIKGMASARNTEDDNDSTRGNYSSAHSGHDSAFGDDETSSKLDLDYIMKHAEENNRQNAKQGDFESGSFITSRVLNGLNNELRKPVSEQENALSISKEQTNKQTTD
jgi:hypothetical protein